MKLKKRKLNSRTKKDSKDIEYLKHRIREHYSQNTVRITCDTIAESKDLTEEWIYNTSFFIQIKYYMFVVKRYILGINEKNDIFKNLIS